MLRKFLIWMVTLLAMFVVFHGLRLFGQDLFPKVAFGLREIFAYVASVVYGAWFFSKLQKLWPGKAVE